MSLTPFSRENMRAFKAQKDKEGHNMMIESIVKKIYVEAVRFAEQKSETVYRFQMTFQTCQGSVELPSNTTQFHTQLYGVSRNSVQYNHEWVVLNMEEILKLLRTVFPDCSVEYKKVSMVRGRDGKDYDITTIDNILRSFIDVRQARTEEHIVIDWT